MMKRMLVVDDEETICAALRDYFETHGYHVECAHELEEAQALLVTGDFSVVLADLRLAGQNGTEGLQLITDVRERRPVTRIVLMTAFGSPEVERAAWSAGADSVLFKPQPLHVIARTIDELEEAH